MKEWIRKKKGEERKKRGRGLARLGLALTLALALGAGPQASQAQVQEVMRIQGANRYETSRRAAQEKPADSLVLASGKNFADSLSAMNLVHGLGSKLVLVHGQESKEDLAQLLARHEVDKVYLVGGENSLPRRLEEEISLPTERIQGANRYATNQASLVRAGFKQVVMASGETFADALCSARFLLENKLGLLLASPANQETWAQAWEVAYVIGGERTLPHLPQAAQRLAGKNRVETSLLLADRTQAKNAILVNAQDFPDALSAVNLVATYEADVLAVPGDPKAQGLFQEAAFQVSGRERLIILGGEKALPASFLQEEGQIKLDRFLEKEEKEEKKPVPPAESTGLSAKEKSLAQQINAYRAKKGLAPLKVSKSLTQVARTHVKDSLTNHPVFLKDQRGIQGNLHSWSLSDQWQGGAYTPDHQHVHIMYEKPRELTSYPGRGYEISTAYQAPNRQAADLLPAMSPEQALEAWIKSPAHHALLISQGPWKDLTAMGIGIDGAYAHVWFGEEADPAGYWSH